MEAVLSIGRFAQRASGFPVLLREACRFPGDKGLWNIRGYYLRMLPVV